MDVNDSQLYIVCAANKVVRWSSDNLKLVNCDKTKELGLLVSFARSKPDILPISITDRPIERVETAKTCGCDFRH